MRSGSTVIRPARSTSALGGRREPPGEAGRRDARRPHHGARADLLALAARRLELDAVLVDPHHHRVEHAGHAQALELALGAVRQVGRERGEHPRPGLDEQDLPGGRVHRAEVARQRVARELGDLARHLDAGRPGAHDGERQPLRALHRVALHLGRLERAKDPAADLECALERLHLGCEGGPLRVAEVGVLRAGRHDQLVVGDLAARQILHRRVRDDDAALEVDLGDLAQHHAHVLRALEHGAQRGRDLAGRQRAGRHLVDERLEEVEVAAVDQRHVDVFVAQLVDRLQPAEAAADHDDAAPGGHVRRRPRGPHGGPPDQQQRATDEQRRDDQADDGREVGGAHAPSAPFTISCASSTIRSRCSSPRNDSA